MKILPACLRLAERNNLVLCFGAALLALAPSVLRAEPFGLGRNRGPQVLVVPPPGSVAVPVPGGLLRRPHWDIYPPTVVAPVGVPQLLLGVPIAPDYSSPQALRRLNQLTEDVDDVYEESVEEARETVVPRRRPVREETVERVAPRDRTLDVIPTLDAPIEFEPNASGQVMLAVTEPEFENGWTPPASVPGPYQVQVFPVQIQGPANKITTAYLARVIGVNGALAAGFDALLGGDWKIQSKTSRQSRSGEPLSASYVTTLSRVETKNGRRQTVQRSLQMEIEDGRLTRLRMLVGVTRNARRGEVTEQVTLLAGNPARLMLQERAEAAAEVPPTAKTESPFAVPGPTELEPLDEPVMSKPRASSTPGPLPPLPEPELPELNAPR